MKNNLLLLAIMSGVLSTSLYARTDSGFQPATVVGVESQGTPSNNDGGDPSDAPLQSVINSYNIDIRLGGTVYRASYNTSFDDLPSVFSPNHPVEVSLRGHVMYVKLAGDRAVAMAIENRAGDSSASTAAGN